MPTPLSFESSTADTTLFEFISKDTETLKLIKLVKSMKSGNWNCDPECTMGELHSLQGPATGLDADPK